MLHDFKNVAVTLSDEGNVAEEIVGRVVGIYQRRLREKYGPSLLTGSSTTQPTIKSLQEAESNDRPKISITPSELAQGHSRNYAEDATYRDPTLGDQGASSDSDGNPETDEQKMLDDWFLALIKTMRADMSNEKLYPAGRVYTMVSALCFFQSSLKLVLILVRLLSQEHWIVFVTPDAPKQTSSRPKPGDPKQFSHKEAHRVVLKLVEDVEKRFGERQSPFDLLDARTTRPKLTLSPSGLLVAVFSRSMLHDHLPSGYEMSTQLLFDVSAIPLSLLLLPLALNRRVSSLDPASRAFSADLETSPPSAPSVSVFYRPLLTTRTFLPYPSFSSRSLHLSSLAHSPLPSPFCCSSLSFFSSTPTCPHLFIILERSLPFLATLSDRPNRYRLQNDPHTRCDL